MNHRRIKQVSFGIMIASMIAGLGFLRDFIFVNINFQLYKLWYGEENYHLPPSLSFLESWEADTLYYAKFPLTLFTILLFFGIAHFTVRYYFREHKYLYLNLVAHLFFCLLGGIFYLYGLVFNDFNNGYHFARIFLDFVQTPLTLMMVLPACKLLETR
ncbi:MAG: hypothetical protein IT233_10230 [Bacteroidia bacterium]|nr:hypothetical protein [Bacteroidia bacterium]